jgi:ClpP class serine protease
MDRDQLIETMSRAIYRAKWDVMMRPDPEREEKFWRMEVSNVTAALAAIEAAGMRMVPVETLQEIARQRLYSEVDDTDPDELDWIGGFDIIVRRVRAMLAAQEDNTSE